MKRNPGGDSFANFGRPTLDMCSSLSTLFGTVGIVKAFLECFANMYQWVFTRRKS